MSALKVWKIAGLVAVVVVGIYVVGSMTWERSTHAGPFAYFQKKYPSLSGQQLLDTANRDIEKYARNQANPDDIVSFMEEAGFTTEKIENPNSLRKDISSDNLTYINFEYKYGVFWWSHRWNFDIFVKRDKSINVIRSFQVCIRCP